ncbi:carbohydrate ABC transporter permease [uncultured Pseudokineococcus sp.]|uniref:carbohydrate ABC transporter permease n=1 Tax=uncultured Pseudokineococcus sp. TaxID=1642928 RepID=UPI002624E79C|nr:carbohydrate ABC transporter permease [uncultured Pseudokineococcus sp.]
MSTAAAPVPGPAPSRRTTAAPPAAGRATTAAEAAGPRRRRRRPTARTWRVVVLALGAVLFLFPFLAMVGGSLQVAPDPTITGLVPTPGEATLANYSAIDGAISLGSGLLNSGIFAGGVILGTVVLGSLAGYALAQMEFRGRGALFGLALLVQVVPFQLLLVPLYILVARDYGLADTHFGVMLPFLVNSTAVIIFRQYFLQLPQDVFEAARIDGASELRVLRSVALPLVRPALLTVVIITFIGPWNEFLWPFLVTKELDQQPLAVSLSNFITTLAGQVANPTGAILAGACVLAAPAVGLFLVFQSRFTSTDIGSSVKG